MTRDGVYKLIKRGKLKATRRSERKTHVSRLALEAYRRRLNGNGPDLRRPAGAESDSDLRGAFERDTGRTPEDWIEAWKAGLIEDSAANAQLLVEALALRQLRQAPDADARGWAIAARSRQEL